MQAGIKAPSVGAFRDALVQAIIKSYAVGESQNALVGLQIGMDQHQLNNEGIVHSAGTNVALIVHFSPGLCQSLSRDCHGAWHSPACAPERSKWFCQQRGKLRGGTASTLSLSTKRRGRPTGSKTNKNG